MAEGIIEEPKRFRHTGHKPRSHGDYQKEWERCTSSAKNLWLEINRNRIEIAMLACEVCDINLGGGYHWRNYEGVKTLASFSKDTGISYKTLNSYTRIYRNIYLKINQNIWDDRNWGAATRTLAKIEKGGVKDEKLIEEIYIMEKNKKGSESRIEKCIKYLGHIRHNLNLIDWNNCTDEQVQKFSDELMIVAATLEK